MLAIPQPCDLSGPVGHLMARRLFGLTAIER